MKFRALLLVFALAASALAMAGLSGLWDRDEPLYARVAAEMLHSGNWILPTFNGQVFAHKPPLGFWAMAASMSIFGVNPLAARLPAVLALTGSGWLTFAIGRRLFVPATGLWSAAMLMSSAMAIHLGSTAMLDAPLLVFICLGMWAHLRVLQRPKRWYRYWPVLAVAMVLAELTKHPVGAATILPAALLSTWLLRKEAAIPRRYWVGLFLAFLAGEAAYLAWLAAAQQSAPGFVAEIHGRHVLGRFMRPMEGHGAVGLIGYLALLPVYLPILLAGFAPWMTFLPVGCSALIRRRIGDRTKRVFLCSWAMPILIFFSLAATKLPHYIFPIFPPAAILSAAALEAWSKNELEGNHRRWMRLGAYLLALVVLAGSAALIVAPVLAGLESKRSAGVLPGILLLGSGSVAVYLLLRGLPRAASRLLLAGTPIVLILSAALILPAIEPVIKVSPMVTGIIRKNRVASEPLAMCGFSEPSLVFCINLPAGESIKILEPNPETIAAWSHGPKAAWLVTYDALWQAARARHGAADDLESVAALPFLNTNDRARREVVRILKRPQRSPAPQG